MKNSVVANFAPEIASQLRNYGKLMRVDKPIGTWLLLWPTLWALWLAGEGAPDQGLFVIFVIGVAQHCVPLLGTASQRRLVQQHAMARRCATSNATTKLVQLR